MVKKLWLSVLVLAVMVASISGCSRPELKEADEGVQKDVYEEENDYYEEGNLDNEDDLTDENIVTSDGTLDDEVDHVNDQSADKENNNITIPVVKLSDTKLLFGTYPKGRVEATKEIIDAVYDNNGDAVVNGLKYRRVSRDNATYVHNYPVGADAKEGFYHLWEDEYEYFRYEPIEWRIVSNENDEYVLISEYSLDCQRYDTKEGLSTWETSDIRSWLNSTFYDIAFSENEKKTIKTTIVDNSNDSTYGDNYGAPTEDKVYLPDYDSIDTKKVRIDTFTTEYGDTMGTLCNRFNIYADDGKYYAAYSTRSLNSTYYIWGVFESRLREQDPFDPAGVRPMISITAASIEFTTELVIADNVTEINVAEYSNCNALTKVTLPEGLTVISEGAFEHCSSLKEINIPSSVKWINVGAFLYCEGLEKMQIPEGIEGIATSAFAACTSLTAINIPESVTSIDRGAFYQSGLVELYLPAGIQYVADNICNNNISLTKVVISEGIRRIEEEAFSRCSSLKEIEIPSSVGSIDDTAFSECGTNLTIVAPAGSEAENYAKKHNISFRAK